MWRVWVGLLLLATPVWADENATAYEALRVVGGEFGRDTAEASHTSFATADYTLRTDERGEPMWIVTLRNRSSRPVGTIYIGGTRGTVMRTEGMFAGATMEDVEGDYDEQTEGPGVIRSAKRSIKHGFNRAQEEARGMFEKVKRSFSDFINRE